MRLLRHALVLAVLTASRVALAAPPATSASAPPEAPPGPAAASSADPFAAASAPPGPTYEMVARLSFGDGLRFNNPYRLATQLGESARTVSLTSPYVDLGVALAIGDTFGLRHGVSLDLSLALSGVQQGVLAPTYFVSYRGSSQRFLAFGRLGPVIVLSPNANAGGEIGLGGALFLSAKSAISAEIVGDLFYGAATRETGYPVYPVVSLQLGLLLDHEVLP